jgi:histidine triad (HIT) family protein
VSDRDTERNRREDVVWRDDLTTAFVSPRWWPNNPGHILVVPNDHAADICEIREDALAAVYATAKRVADALRISYGCEGTSTRQHNGPAAGQDVFHFHVHVFPRYAGDELYARDAEHRWTTADERAPYARRLREALR